MNSWEWDITNLCSHWNCVLALVYVCFLSSNCTDSLPWRICICFRWLEAIAVVTFYTSFPSFLHPSAYSCYMYPSDLTMSSLIWELKFYSSSQLV